MTHRCTVGQEACQSFSSSLVSQSVSQAETASLGVHELFLGLSKGYTPRTQLTFECRALDRTRPKAF